MKRALAIALLVAGCGGKTGTLEVKIVTPAGDDPFVGAAKARIAVGEPVAAEQTVSVDGGGHFNLQLKFPPPGGNPVVGPVLVEVYDAANQVIARGRSPVIGFTVGLEARIAVWVGRVGRVGLSPSSLPRGRKEIAAGPIPRLGALLAGGLSGGDLVTDVEVYDAFFHQLVKATPLPSPRTAARVLGFDRQSELTGAALLIGGDGDGKIALFDPIARSLGGWSDYASDVRGRFRPATAVLRDGGVLVVGGTSTHGQGRVAAAALIDLPGRTAVTPLPDLAVARAGHTATFTQSTSGDAVLIFGGVAPGAKNAPVAELYLPATRRFESRDLAGVASRFDHTATALPDGRLVIAGGGEGMARATASGFVLTPPMLSVDQRPALLATARAGHTATAIGGEVVICGGLGADGVPLADCEILDGATLALKRTIPLASARARHTAVLLDGGTVLLAGGVGPDDTPVTALELYTP